ncbi:hypothetical protein [Massilia sp. YIM B04103]|uniref:hypothetical protein n=1 Tax=Massilia sp. YIM B04103 TaxID=2963106 RepID=UPI00210DBF69|nr:hypothetical protein [Massilia sp. YIM B04103]
MEISHRTNNDAMQQFAGPALARQLNVECEAMARHALRHGLPVPAELIARLAILLALAHALAQQGAGAGRRDNHLAELADIHQKLATAVAPATPQGIRLLDPEQLIKQRFAWLGPVPLIRMLTSVAAAFLLAVLLTALSGEVSGQNIKLGLLESSGTVLLLNVLFLLFCAGLGASFSTLFHAHRYIANLTYDPKYDASYCARLILGLISGLILAELLPAHIFNEGSMSSFSKPVLAMLGGFSATAVHNLLQRLVETLEAVVRGDPSARYQSTLDAHKAQLFTDRAQSRNELAAQLLSLQQASDGDASPEALRRKIADLTRSMLSPQTARAESIPAPADAKE